MAVWQYLGRRLWVIALVAMVAYVAMDTVIHLRTTYTVSTQHLFTPPVADPKSPTGYVLGQRDEILPYVGMDGYHWVMQTQDMLARGDWRERWVDYDNYTAQQPSGREVHWSSSFRWWVALLAGIEHLYGGVPLPWTVEDVMPFANTLLIVLLVVMLAPAIARRFGSGLAAMMIFGMAAITPVYESFSEGKSDHHGLASLSALLTLLFLLGGAAGWVRADEGEGAASPVAPAWLPTRAQARFWFILSGLLFGLALAITSLWQLPGWTGGLLGAAAMNGVFTITLWLSARPAAPAPGDVGAASAPDSPPPETTGPALFAWLPAPNPRLARWFFIGSAALGGLGLADLAYQYSAYYSSTRTDSHYLPINVDATISAWLFGLALANILLAFVLLLKSPSCFSAPAEDPEEASGPKLLAWLPNRRQARRWFIASGIAGGVGLWVSTASEAPVLAEVGMGALLATGLLARGVKKDDRIQADPSLWRVWGWSGAATSIFFYLLEYFPSHLGMRLEVNHPLYAFAWAGGGEILFRLCRWWGGGKLAERPADWAWLGGSAFAVFIVPAIIFIFADQVFWIASWTPNSRFLFIFHEDYIAEFKDMLRYLGGMYASPSAVYSVAVLNPLVLLTVPMLLWAWRPLRPFLYGGMAIGLPMYALFKLLLRLLPGLGDKFPLDHPVLLFVVGPLVAVVALVCWLRPAWEKKILLFSLAVFLLAYDIFLGCFQSYLFSPKQTDYPGDYYTWLFLGVPLAILFGLLCLWEPWKKFPRPCQALLALALPGGTLTCVLSLREMRWMEIGYAFWLAALVGVFLALKLHDGYRWTWARRVSLGLFLTAVLLPNPLLTCMDWVRFHFEAAMSEVEVMELVTRDFSQRLRARLGSETGVVVSGPTTTTWMSYWGGFKGLGTLYWENLPGLKADMAIYSADSPEKAMDLIKKYGVTHISIFSWDPFYKQYSRLSREMHRPVDETEYEAEKPLRQWITSFLPHAFGKFDNGAAELPIIQNDFVHGLIEGQKVPAWLRFVAYPMPADQSLRGNYIYTYEVVPDQTLEESRVRLAQGQMALGSLYVAEQTINNLVVAKPDYLPGLICFARVENLLADNRAAGAPERQAHANNFATIFQAIHAALPRADTLAFDDRLELAITLVLGNDNDAARVQVQGCVKMATLRDLRRITPEQLYNLLSFMRQMNLLDARPGFVPLLLSLLPIPQRAQYFVEQAEQEKQAGRVAPAVALLRRALDLQSDSLNAVMALARILATAHDPALRNGREALVLARQAHQLDMGQHADVMDILACAYAEAGDFALAETTEQLAANLAETAQHLAANPDEAARAAAFTAALRSRVLNFHNQQPFHE